MKTTKVYDESTVRLASLIGALNAKICLAKNLPAYLCVGCKNNLRGLLSNEIIMLLLDIGNEAAKTEVGAEFYREALEGWAADPDMPSNIADSVRINQKLFEATLNTFS